MCSVVKLCLFVTPCAVALQASLCPWNFSGKNTGVSCSMCWKVIDLTNSRALTLISLFLTICVYTICLLVYERVQQNSEASPDIYNGSCPFAIQLQLSLSPRYTCYICISNKTFHTKMGLDSEKVTGRKARGLQTEEIGCKCQFFVFFFFNVSLKQQEKSNYKY